MQKIYFVKFVIYSFYIQMSRLKGSNWWTTESAMQKCIANRNVFVIIWNSRIKDFLERIHVHNCGQTLYRCSNVNVSLTHVLTYE